MTWLYDWTLASYLNVINHNILDFVYRALSMLPRTDFIYLGSASRSPYLLRSMGLQIQT